MVFKEHDIIYDVIDWAIVPEEERLKRHLDKNMKQF